MSQKTNKKKRQVELQGLNDWTRSQIEKCALLRMFLWLLLCQLIQLVNHSSPWSFIRVWAHLWLQWISVAKMIPQTKWLQQDPNYPYSRNRKGFVISCFYVSFSSVGLSHPYSMSPGRFAQTHVDSLIGQAGVGQANCLLVLSHTTWIYLYVCTYICTHIEALTV